MLYFIRDMVIVGGNGSVRWGNRDEGGVGDQEGLHLITHGDGLTRYFVIRFNLFLACQTQFVQPELLVGDATGMQVGDCVLFREQMVIGTVDTICAYTFFFCLFCNSESGDW